MIVELFWVGFGGALGATSRYLVGKLPIPLPAYGKTWLINIIGCLLIGFFMARFQYDPSPSYRKAWLITGFCGGFTTFSTFSLELWQLGQQQHYLHFIVYLTLSVLVGISAVAIGMSLGHH